MEQRYVQDALIDLLLKAPALQSKESRDALLFRLDELSASIPRSNVAVTDVISIIRSLAAVGQLDTGEWPLEILMRNAQRYCPSNTELGRQLNDLLVKFEPSFDRQQLALLPEIVIGTDERLPISFLEKGLLAQKSVARLLVPRLKDGHPIGSPPQSVTGTGWMIGPGLLLTNYHVVDARFPNEEPASSADLSAQAQRIVTWFGYQSWDANHIDYGCNSVVQANKRLDYALLRIAEQPLFGDTPLSEWGHLTIVKSQPAMIKGSRLSIIQHPRGEEKKLAIRSNFYVGRTSSAEEPARIQYLTDTEPGASGSPVFDDSWQVVALHHGSMKVSESQYRGDVVKYNNQGIEISAILDDLEPSVRSQILS